MVAAVAVAVAVVAIEMALHLPAFTTKYEKAH
jgi:hypothetical protein